MLTLPFTIRSLRDQIGDSLRLRNIDCVASLHVDGCRSGALRHETLRIWRDHLVIGGDKITGRLALPRGIGHRAVECVQSQGTWETPMNSASPGSTSAAKESANFPGSRKRKPSCGGMIGGTGAPGTGSLIRVPTDSPLSRVNAVT